MKETEEMKGLSNRALLSRQQEQTSRQDEKLEIILDGVKNLKDMSHGMNQELGRHMQLTDEITPALERTDGRIRQNIGRIGDIEEKSTGCCPLLTMILLLIVIVFLLSSNAPCHIFNPSRC